MVDILRRLLDLLTTYARRLQGLLTTSTRFQRGCHWFFGKIHRKKSWRYTFQLALVYGLVAISRKIIGYHQIPNTGWSEPIVYGVLPATLVLAGLGISALPVGVLAFFEARFKRRDIRLRDQLSRHLKECSLCEHTQEFSTADAIPHLLKTLKKSDGPATFISPNAMYLLADRLLDRDGSTFDKSTLKKTLREVADNAWSLRSALQEYTEPVHWILPDPDYPRVTVFLEQRADRLGLPGKIAHSTNSRAAKWIRKDLKRERAKRRQRTYLHLVRCLPSHRVLVTNDKCFFQEFLDDRPGLTTPVFLANRDTDPHLFDLLELILETWCAT